jgi:hypothetical protein
LAAGVGVIPLVSGRSFGDAAGDDGADAGKSASTRRTGGRGAGVAAAAGEVGATARGAGCRFADVVEPAPTAGNSVSTRRTGGRGAGAAGAAAGVRVLAVGATDSAGVGVFAAALVLPFAGFAVVGGGSEATGGDGLRAGSG